MEEIQDLFEKKLNELKTKDYRKYRNLMSELFEWGAVIGSNLDGNGNLGSLVEAQIICIAEDTKTKPEEMVNSMFNAYIMGSQYAFARLFHHARNPPALSYS